VAIVIGPSVFVAPGAVAPGKGAVDTTVPGDAGSVATGAGACAGAGGVVDAATMVPADALCAMAGTPAAEAVGINEENHAEIAGQFS
jgi:hypothetical protein